MIALDQWVEENASDLESDIRIHVEELAPEVSLEDQNTLIRFIMMSIRQWQAKDR